MTSRSGTSLSAAGVSSISPRSTADSSASTSSCERIFSVDMRRLLDHELGEVHAAHVLQAEFLVHPLEQRLLQFHAAVLRAEGVERHRRQHADQEIGDLRLLLLDLLRLL